MSTNLVCHKTFYNIAADTAQTLRRHKPLIFYILAIQAFYSIALVPRQMAQGIGIQQIVQRSALFGVSLLGSMTFAALCVSIYKNTCVPPSRPQGAGPSRGSPFRFG